MSLLKLEISNLRNITNLSLEPSSAINLIYGANGSGKTSILEAIHLLALGRSFRSKLLSRVIQNETAKLSVHGLINSNGNQTIPLGFEKSKTSEVRIRISGQDANCISDLAKYIPMLLIDNSAHQLLTAGPNIRRKFIDWGLFHVEPSFFTIWKHFQSALSQRNAAIRQGVVQHVKVWNDIYVKYALQIEALREDYIAAFKPVFYEISATIADISQISLEYQAGWDKTRDLAEILEQSIQKDLALGYTYYGPQRADLNIASDNAQAQHVLSQGQQKALVFALKVAQGIHLHQTNNKLCIYLVDDLPSELDRNHAMKLSEMLARLSAQVFITGVDIATMDFFAGDIETKRFHVEQGRIKEELAVV